jgi:hypothetical protein
MLQCPKLRVQRMTKETRPNCRICSYPMTRFEPELEDTEETLEIFVCKYHPPDFDLSE